MFPTYFGLTGFTVYLVFWKSVPMADVAFQLSKYHARRAAASCGSDVCRRPEKGQAADFTVFFLSTGALPRTR